jgi:hypothetical protein
MTTPEQLVNQIRAATDYQINKQLLREKIQTDLHVTYKSGLFKVSPELIAFLNSWNAEILYIEDVYQNPIEVNRNELLSICLDHYQMVMNVWHIEHEKLKSIRKI